MDVRALYNGAWTEWLLSDVAVVGPANFNLTHAPSFPSEKEGFFRFSLGLVDRKEI